LSEIPILGHDEARDAGLLPQSFLQGEIKDFFGHNVYGIPNTFIILTSIPHWLFGQTVFSVRILAAIFGSLTVILAYFLAKKFFDSKVGLITSLIMASYHVHLHFSRTEFLNLFDSFWACLVIWLLLVAIQSHLFFSLLLGLSLGFSLHFYQGIRATVLFVGAYFSIYLLKNFSSFSVKKFFSLTMGFLIGLGPTLLVIFIRPHQFWDTGNAGKSFLDFYAQEGVGGLIKFSTLLPNKIFTSLAAIIVEPIDFHYRYGGPFLILPLALFFIVGLIVLLKNFTKKESNILVFWILSVIFFNSVLPESVNFTHRLLSLVPALVIIAALGIYKTAVIFRKPALLSSLLIGALTLFVTIQNIKLYFFDSAWKRTISLNAKVATTAGFYTKQFDSEINFYFLNSSRMSWKSVPSWEYLSGEQKIIDLEKTGFRIQVLKIREKTQKVVFIVLPERESDFKLVKQIFPNCHERRFYFDDDFLFFSYECIN